MREELKISEIGKLEGSNKILTRNLFLSLNRIYLLRKTSLYFNASVKKLNENLEITLEKEIGIISIYSHYCKLQ